MQEGDLFSHLFLSHMLGQRSPGDPPLIVADLKGRPGYILHTYCEGIEAIGSRAGAWVQPGWLPPGETG